jgi:hypothetical protein
MCHTRPSAVHRRSYGHVVLLTTPRSPTKGMAHQEYQSGWKTGRRRVGCRRPHLRPTCLARPPCRRRPFCRSPPGTTKCRVSALTLPHLGSELVSERTKPTVEGANPFFAACRTRARSGMRARQAGDAPAPRQVWCDPAPPRPDPATGGFLQAIAQPWFSDPPGHWQSL